MEELKPCPFCGADDISVWDKSRYDVCVRCNNCYCKTGWYSTIDDAVTAWNTRPDNPDKGDE